MGHNETSDVLKEYINSEKFKTSIQKNSSYKAAIQKECESIAKDFIDSMKYAVNEAERAGKINDWKISDITYVLSDLSVKDIVTDGNTVTIKIDYNQDLERPSFSGGPVRNIASLLNTGYVTKSKQPIRGVWHDELIFSRRIRVGAYFIENAIQHFRSRYPTRVLINSQSALDVREIRVNVGDIQEVY